jgi:hypothetical protein
MADSSELTAAYDDAMAVMSRPCRFVEWKMYGGGDDVTKWSPFGPAKDRSGAWKEIQGERWIYVFRSYARIKSAGVWVEELHLSKDGDISATPMHEAARMEQGMPVPLERDKRPAPVPVGKAMSFARRINGFAMEYYFFASRIRLPAASIQAIGPNIMAYAPPINFEENDSNMAADKGGAPLVPVLDPITIALHLHACYVAAADDFIDYTTVHAEQSDEKKKQVLARGKKHLLAQLIHGLVDPKVDTNNELVNRLRRQGIDLEDFLTDYNLQIKYRLGWRDRWCGLLARWLTSETMGILAKAHLFAPLQDFHKLLIPFCLCLTRTSESPAGRALLDNLHDTKDHWIHQFILPTSALSNDQLQIVRKGGGAAFEALKEWGPRIVLEPAKYGKFQFVTYFNNLAGETILVKGQFGAVHVPGEVVVETIGHGGSRVQISEVPYLLKEEKVTPKWKGAVTKLSAIVEAVNLAVAVKSLVDAMQGDSAWEKALAITNLLGSGLDATNAILQFTKVSEHVLAKIGFVSGIIDTALAIASTVEAYKQGDMGGMVGSGVIAVGSGVSAYAALLLLGESASAGPVGIAALAIVALGYTIKLFFGDNDTPYHKLVAHCEWGLDAGRGSQPVDWAPAPYEAWKGDYDLQLRAAVAVVCGFSIDIADIADLRQARIETRWIPAGSTLEVRYSEEWSGAGPIVFTDRFVFGDNGPVSTTKLLTITPGKDRTYVVRPQKRPDERPSTKRALANVPVKADGLDRIRVEAQLAIDLGGLRLRIPEKKPMGTDLA